MVWNTRLGVYHARYYRYLDVVKHILGRYPLPSGVSEKLDTWWQGEFLAEMKKWVDEPRKLLFAPSYDAAVNELATLITEKVEDGMQMAQDFSAFAKGPDRSEFFNTRHPAAQPATQPAPQPAPQPATHPATHPGA
ncbi:hypothetical protein BDQ94DRAFT_168563 [Aspergillus welwitschiae]|uniref:Uncharacterized protein n=1 Tax=Aspergillus welwitschiae TaxID=1341132 RepID=A0A3F3Q9R4_9EURO|nr:hypothetical protein BDQ94DRAFT_168563 [Aspergillus welwitschiae]RDH35552.1 hypothetical protein BDQ94DRAFT_168563 [Aspergillus welwitschiae]